MKPHHANATRLHQRAIAPQAQRAAASAEGRARFVCQVDAQPHVAGFVEGIHRGVECDEADKRKNRWPARRRGRRRPPRPRPRRQASPAAARTAPARRRRRRRGLDMGRDSQQARGAGGRREGKTTVSPLASPRAPSPSALSSPVRCWTRPMLSGIRQELRPMVSPRRPRRPRRDRVDDDGAG